MNRSHLNSPFSGEPSPALEAAIGRALSRPPEIAIPPSFAARVARHAIAQPLAQPSSLTGWGPRLTLASFALLTVALFALAPHAAPSLSNLRFDAEMVLFAELSAIAVFAPRLLTTD